MAADELSTVPKSVATEVELGLCASCQDETRAAAEANGESFAKRKWRRVSDAENRVARSSCIDRVLARAYSGATRRKSSSSLGDSSSDPSASGSSSSGRTASAGALSSGADTTGSVEERDLVASSFG